MLGGQRLPAAVLAADCGQDRWHPPVCGRGDQSGGGGGAPHRGPGPGRGDAGRCQRWPFPPRSTRRCMARLDRLGSAKGVAQLGATLGRQFPYALLRAVAPLEDEPLQRDLATLVAAELLYQRGQPPRAVYTFKHALIQEAAYESVLQERAPADPSAHPPGAGGTVSRDGGDRSPHCWPTMRCGASCGTRPWPISGRPGSRRWPARPIGRRWPPSSRRWGPCSTSPTAATRASRPSISASRCALRSAHWAT